MSDRTESGGSDQQMQDGDVPADLFVVWITVSRENYAELLQRFDLDVGCRPHIQVNPDGNGSLLVYATEERLRAVETAGYAVEWGENVSALGRERQHEIGEGDRFQGGRVAPRGLGHKPGHGSDGGSAR